MIRTLTDPTEIAQARDLHAASESCGALPDDRTIVGAVTDEGEVVGITGVEQVIFIGPQVIKPEWRGKHLAAQMIEHIRDRAPEGSWVVIASDNGHVRKLAREFGLTQVPGELWMGEVKR